MKKGDIVIIRDSSYSKVITADGLKGGYVGPHSVRNEQGVIVEVGCSFPDPHRFQQQWRHFNNTIVRTDSGKIVFIEECFLKLVPPKHKVMIDVSSGPCITYGEIVEISDKLYKEIKREAQTK